MGACVSKPPSEKASGCTASDKAERTTLIPTDSKEQHPRWIQTIDDTILIEKIRDIIDDSECSITKPNESYQTRYKDIIFTKFNLSNHHNQEINRLKERIIYIINEIETQTIGDHFSSVSSETKDPDYSYSDIFDIDALLMPHKELQRLQSVQQLQHSDEYILIINQYQPQLQNLLKHKNNTYKTPHDLITECSDIKCQLSSKQYQIHDDILCEPLKRIDLMLSVYKELKTQDTLWRKVPISDILSVNNYGYQQLHDDWLHVKIVHIDGDKDSYNSIARKLCDRYRDNIKWSCNDLLRCAGYQRHYRDRNNDEEERELYFRRWREPDISKIGQILNNKDIVFQQECDKIHSYLLHSTIKWGTGMASMLKSKSAEEQAEQIMKHSKGRSYSSNKHDIGSKLQIELNETDIKMEEKQLKNIYVGKKEDETWWKNIDDIDINLNQSGIRKNINKGFGELVSKMGIFRYQSAHGFRCGQNRGLHHLKARYKNIKEEALHNSYYALSIDSWNQTVRKCKVFYQSWARHKIRSPYNGQYQDRITGITRCWNKGMEILLTELVTFKLYTDFDKIQFQLKKCFRWETIMDIRDKERNRKRIGLQRMDLRVQRLSSDVSIDVEDEGERARRELEDRLKEFFHWRSELLVVLNKYGKRMGANDVLYHGVNAKMILNPTETMAFYGPLSTTSSFHVARTFATKKGMVLKITTHYPRINVCNAFDASLISDYPEEQEFLIGFIYLRVLEVRTSTLSVYDDEGWKYNDDNSWNASMVRSIFFSINLFRQQMFCMSHHLEYHLRTFLQQILPVNDDHDMHCDDFTENVEYLKSVIENTMNDKYSIKQAHKEGDLRRERQRKILKILWEKFDEFRKEPNLKQIIKIDTVSDGLKCYFMEESKDKDINNLQSKRDISFTKIIKVFPNVREIHFLNNWTLNDTTLSRLMDEIKKSDNKLCRIKFLYYQYKERPTESMYFYNPQHLDTVMLDQLKHGIKSNDNQIKRWKFIHSEIKNVGYKIRLFES